MKENIMYMAAKGGLRHAFLWRAAYDRAFICQLVPKRAALARNVARGRVKISVRMTDGS